MSRLFKTILVVCAFVLVAGCASEEALIEPPSESTLGEETFESSPALNLNMERTDSVEVVIGDTLTFSDALSKALLHNPRLQSFAWQVRVREAERLQAALPLNPALEAEMENIAGTGPFEGYGARETTVRLSQQIQLGLDRIKAKRVAAFNKTLASWDYETQRLDVLTRVTGAYISALEAQRQLEVQRELVRIAESLHETVAKQVEAGKVSGLEQTRTRVELSRARIDLQNALNGLDAARSNLASYWGAQQADFLYLKGQLKIQEEVPSLASVRDYIDRNPDVARWATEIRQQQAVVSLERARGIPDITLNGGYKYMNDQDAGAAVVGISIPLPFFDRNQGNIKAAEYEVNRVEARREAAVTEVYRALGEAYNRLQSARHEVERLREEVLPGAETAFNAAQTGYNQGKFDYLVVLDAQRTLFTSRTRYIQALAEYNRTVAEVERLIGTSLTEIISN